MNNIETKPFMIKLSSLGYILVEATDTYLAFERGKEKGDHCILKLYYNGDVLFYYKNLTKGGYGPFNKDVPWVMQNDEVEAITMFREELKL